MIHCSLHKLTAQNHSDVITKRCIVVTLKSQRFLLLNLYNRRCFRQLSKVCYTTITHIFPHIKYGVKTSNETRHACHSALAMIIRACH